jgi:hypothetical protein
MTGSSGPPVRNRLLVRNGLLLRSPLSSPQEPQKNPANGRWMKVPRLANRFHPLFCLVTAIGAQLPPAPCCASLPELPIWLKSFTGRPVSRPASARSRAEILLKPSRGPPGKETSHGREDDYGWDADWEQGPRFADSPLEGRGFELSVPLQKPTGVDHPGSAAAERREVQVGLIIR